MSFWSGKRVLVTGHTGFKGSWLTLWLTRMGARVAGLALAPDTTPALFEQLALADRIDHALGDIRNLDTVRARVAQIRPDVVLHLAAQPLVLASYEDPLETWSTNVMGSAHLLEALRALDHSCAVVMVTTDKVYLNVDAGQPFAETDPLGGHDPYSASKAAMEIAVDSWRKSFFGDHPVRIASARAGNVIGGGDWAANRLVPDLMRGLATGQEVAIRNPDATRPWQHVLEPLAGYLRLAERLWSGGAAHARAYNFGPDAAATRTVRDLADTVLTHWPGSWRDTSGPGQRHEAALLSLDIGAARADLGITPRWDFDQTVEMTVEWYRAAHEGADPVALCLAQIEAFGAP